MLARFAKIRAGSLSWSRPALCRALPFWDQWTAGESNPAGEDRKPPLALAAALRGHSCFHFQNPRSGSPAAARSMWVVIGWPSHCEPRGSQRPPMHRGRLLTNAPACQTGAVGARGRNQPAATNGAKRSRSERRNPLHQDTWRLLPPLQKQSLRCFP